MPKRSGSSSTTGSVGSQTLVGLPATESPPTNAPSFSGRLSIWPFDGGLRVPDRPLVLAEVYPSLLKDAVAQHPDENGILDRAQVRVNARAFASLDAEDGLQDVFGGAMSLTRRPTSRRRSGRSMDSGPWPRKGVEERRRHSSAGNVRTALSIFDLRHHDQDWAWQALIWFRSQSSQQSVHAAARFPVHSAGILRRASTVGARCRTLIPSNGGWAARQALSEAFWPVEVPPKGPSAMSPST